MSGSTDRPKTGPFEMHVISNTHWDREWLYNFQETRLMLVELMDRLLDILESASGARYHSYVLDSQVVPVEDYLEVRPDRRERIEKQVRAGRLLIGPWYTAPLEYQVSGESLVRNLLVGHRLGQAMGGVMKVGYTPFSYGQCSQMPQIYSGFGIDSILFYHGIVPWESRSEFIFEGADGTRIFASRMGSYARYNFFFHVYRPTVWGRELRDRQYDWTQGMLPFHLCSPDRFRGHYFLVTPEPRLDKSRLQEALAKLKAMEMDHCTSRYLAYMQGHDSTAPHPLELDVIEEAKALVGEDTLLHSSLPEWVAKAKASAEGLVVLKGERRTPRMIGRRPHLYGDVASTRTRMKRHNQRAEQLLQRWAEPFAALAWTMGREYPEGALDLAWRYLLRCHAHDSIAGAGVDQIERDVHNRLEQVEGLANGIMRRSLEYVQSRIDNSDAPADTVLLTVFNPSPFPRSEVVTAALDLPKESGVSEFRIVDATTGEAVQHQEMGRAPASPVVRHLYDAPCKMPSLRVDAHIEAKDVPALGYRTYRLVPQEKRAPQAGSLRAGPTAMENEHLRVDLNRDGTLRLTHKATGRVFDSVHYFEDDGEAGHAWRHVPPAYDRVVTSLGGQAQVSLEEAGPLLCRFRIDYRMMIPARIEYGDTDQAIRPDAEGDVARRSEQEGELRLVSRVTLRRGARSVEVATKFDNQCRDHRLRVLFPSGVKATHACAETPFDVVERPIDRGPDSPWYGTWNPTHPHYRFVDVSDGGVGLAVINDGLREYEVTDDETRTIALTLMRAFELNLTTVAWQWEPHPEMTLTQAQGEHEFHYAVYPHAGDWAAGGVLQEADRLNLPLEPAQVGPHAGDLPKHASLLQVEPESVAVSAVKRSEDGRGLAVRLFNPTSETVAARVSLWKPVREAWLTNLNEETPVALPVEGGAVRVTLGPKKIATVLITL